ncbi:tetratricopeptide repeat protein [Porticoccus sp.]
MSLTDNLETMLAQGKDSAMLRFGLGSAYCNEKRYEQAIPHLQQCLALDPSYSAAYKLLGRALMKQGQFVQAQQIFTTGLEKAILAGDKQTEREISVFLKKLPQG